MRVITWNLFHGRSVPESRGDLYARFEELIAGWEWDVLLLQEAPPWWPERLAAAAGARYRRALTSRNFALPVRRAIATWRPELIKANGGGCNAILVRDRRITDHRIEIIRRVPERRLVHGVRLEGGLWICNVHMQGERSHLLKPNPAGENKRVAEVVRGWAGERTPVLLGGDWNVLHPVLPGFQWIPDHRGVDALFMRGMTSEGVARAFDRGDLSDHRPVRATLLA